MFLNWLLLNSDMVKVLTLSDSSLYLSKSEIAAITLEEAGVWGVDSKEEIKKKKKKRKVKKKKKFSFHGQIKDREGKIFIM